MHYQFWTISYRRCFFCLKNTPCWSICLCRAPDELVHESLQRKSAWTVERWRSTFYEMNSTGKRAFGSSGESVWERVICFCILSSNASRLRCSKAARSLDVGVICYSKKHLGIYLSFVFSVLPLGTVKVGKIGTPGIPDDGTRNPTLRVRHTLKCNKTFLT